MTFITKVENIGYATINSPTPQKKYSQQYIKLIKNVLQIFSQVTLNQLQSPGRLALPKMIGSGPMLKVNKNKVIVGIVLLVLLVFFVFMLLLVFISSSQSIY